MLQTDAPNAEPLGECQEPTDAEKELRRLASAKSNKLFLKSFLGHCLKLGFAILRVPSCGTWFRVRCLRGEGLDSREGEGLRYFVEFRLARHEAGEGMNVQSVTGVQGMCFLCESRQSSPRQNPGRHPL